MFIKCDADITENLRPKDIYFLIYLLKCIHQIEFSCWLLQKFASYVKFPEYAISVLKVYINTLSQQHHPTPTPKPNF